MNQGRLILMSSCCLYSSRLPHLLCSHLRERLRHERRRNRGCTNREMKMGGYYTEVFFRLLHVESCKFDVAPSVSPHYLYLHWP